MRVADLEGGNEKLQKASHAAHAHIARIVCMRARATAATKLDARGVLPGLIFGADDQARSTS